MPLNKEAVLRYAIIDRCLCNRFRLYPSMEELKRVCEEELGKEFSTSTIQKDIKAMKEDELLGYLAPIKFSKSHNGYYYADPEYSIRKIGLNDGEIEAIEFATGILEQFKGARVNEAFNNAIDKVLTSVTVKKAERYNGLKHAIQMENTTPLKGMEHMDKLVEAIKEKLVINFVHYSYQEKRWRVNTVHPYLLKEHRNRWYLIGYSEKHKETRMFGIDRIFEPVFTKKPFHESKHTDSRLEFRDKIGINTLGKEKREVIKLWVSGAISNYIKSMPLHQSQQTIEQFANGAMLIALEIIPTFELISTILSYGKDMSVESPNWLKNKLIEELQTSLGNYHKQKNRKLG